MRALARMSLIGACLALAAGAKAQECAPLEGAELMDTWAGVVFLGENHGTRQIPDMAGRLICRQLQRGRRIHVALEWPEHWTPVLQAYLLTDTPDEARRLLLEKTDWMQRQRRFADGLTSQAMVSLLESLRQWRRQGAAIELSSFDTRQWQSPQHFSDVGMAAMLTRNLEARPSDLAVVLSGEFHTRLVPETGPIAWPMAFLVRAARPEWTLHTVAVRWAGGSLWGCGPERCGVLEQPQRGAAAPVQLSPFPEADALGYSAQLQVGRIEASPPWPAGAP